MKPFILVMVLGTFLIDLVVNTWQVNQQRVEIISIQKVLGRMQAPGVSVDIKKDFGRTTNKMKSFGAPDGLEVPQWPVKDGVPK